MIFNYKKLQQMENSISENEIEKHLYFKSLISKEDEIYHLLF